MKHSYFAKIGILLIVVALVAGILSCNGVVTYSLTMAENPVGGGTATDETGTSPYARNDVVDIKAVANTGYEFAGWTAPAGSLADEDAEETTFTMPAQNVTVTANFVGPLDHATVYYVNEASPSYIDEEVYLEDQFGAFHALVENVEGFAIPAEKMYGDETTPIYNPDHSLTLYYISCEEEPGRWVVDIENQFGNQTLTVEGPFGLAVPTQNGDHGEPLGLDHYLLYYVDDYTYLDEVYVELNDELLNEPLVSEVYEPMVFANPVRKTHGAEVTEILNPDVHAVGYMTDWGDVDKTVDVVNQFGEQTLDVDGPYGLVVPSEKISWEPVEPGLDHFKSYWVDEMVPPVYDVVQLEDQFVTITANVTYPILFANPVNKWHGEEGAPIMDPRDHLMFYGIDILDGEPGEWEVVVDNQFGTGQWLRVYGPTLVAVPTEKDFHGQPEDLNHFLVYEVLDWEITPMAGVYLWDQFTPGEPEWNTVDSPMLFAVPAQKTHGPVTTPIKDDEHLLFYSIDGGLGDWLPMVSNQFFGPEAIPVYQGDGDWFPPFDLLGVPSEKISWEQPLDHFKYYYAEDMTELPINEVVYLEDQFGAVNATVGWAWGFCNPVEKWHDEVLTPISDIDHHLTMYEILYAEEPQEWFVEVDNQFGTQQLTVSGPVWLAVPTQKEGHDPPVGLDHFLLYEVIDGPYMEVVVGLSDQFVGYEEVLVSVPVLFANPVRKTHGATVTEIENPGAHLVFYGIEGGVFETMVLVDNQFGEQFLDVYDPSLLAVPSWKTCVITEPTAFAAVLGDYNSQLTNLLLANNIWAEERDWADVISDIGDYDVVVVNEPDDPGETTFLDFLDAASDNGVGVVFTRSYSEGFSWGISLLEWYLSDPAGQSQDWGSGDVYYKVTQAHSIFAGWNVDDEITIITGGDCDHAWFWDYTGTTIAEVGSADYGVQGDAVAVGAYGGSTHVLLASLGPQLYTNVMHWTDDGKTIFINAVLFAI